ncbi:N-acetyltransferase [Ferrovibrio sp.]|uniref:GNAT family N-acetyltransferase n=1 Tax=Ferrovibrio sp. TaxID=1917215 RepID=UPI0025C45460|nr:N-acetyltransferase [Ferrovibrio sp.]MBX3453962.1 GNAT family N-acetyltransferase [Ferrovibrio sp.]
MVVAFMVSARNRQALGRQRANGKGQAASQAAQQITLGIRPAKANDLEALLVLENTCFQSDRMSRRAFRRALGNPRAQIAVVPGPGSGLGSGPNSGLGSGPDGGLLGAAVVYTRQDSPAARLYSIAVHPAARGQGLARRLLRHMEIAAQKNGAREMRLEVSINNRAALALYEESGYEIFARVSGYYEDGADALRLAKPLAPRPGSN